MILVDTALKKREEEGRPIRVGLVGAGAMAQGIARLIINTVPGMELTAISNRKPERGLQTYRDCGVENVVEAGSLDALEDAARKGRAVVTDDSALLCSADCVDVLVDATGAVEFGAQLALGAFAGGKDVISMNVELDATVGSAIQHHARKAGVIYTIADGDQPALQINLMRYMRGIGLEPLVCGNIKGLQDHYRTPTTQQGFAEQWNQNVYMVTSFADGSKISMEQASVANAAGMQVEQRGMRGGDFEGHVDALCHNGRYDVDALRKLGGVVDYVVKAQPAPGVFVFGTVKDAAHAEYLKLYKMGDGPLYSFYQPYHLCYFDVPLSVGRVALFRDQILEAKSPMVDVVATAKRALKKGEVIDSIGGYMCYGQCENHEVVRSEKLLPQGLAKGCTLVRDVAKDEVVGYEDVIFPEGKLCNRLRAEQEALFPE